MGNESPFERSYVSHYIKKRIRICTEQHFLGVIQLLSAFSIKKEEAVVYTKEQNKEIEKVIAAFADYIHDANQFDVVWSDKVGYVLLDGIYKDYDDLGIFPTVLRTGEALCKEIIHHMACDVVERENGGRLHDLDLCTVSEQKEIRKALSVHMDQLPEYAHLIDQLFID